MKLTVLKEIKEDLDNVKNVWVEAFNGDSKVQEISVALQHIKTHNFVQLHPSLESCTSFKFRVLFNDDIIKYFSFDKKQDAIYTSRIASNLSLEDDERYIPSYNEHVIQTKCNISDVNLINNITPEKLFNINCYIINLEKDEQRLKNTTKQLTSVGFKNIHTWQATQANTSMSIEEQLKKLGCMKTTHNFKNSNEVACTTSHIKLLQDFLKSTDNYRLIFEDDIIMHSNFLEEINKLQMLSFDSFEVLFFGGWLWSYKNADAKIKNNELNFYTFELKSIEAHAYLIDRRFAYKALKTFFEADTKMTIDMHYAFNMDSVGRCLLTTSPHTSDNTKHIKNDDGKRCGLIYQANIYTSNIQPIEAEQLNNQQSIELPTATKKQEKPTPLQVKPDVKLRSLKPVYNVDFNTFKKIKKNY